MYQLPRLKRTLQTYLDIIDLALEKLDTRKPGHRHVCYALSDAALQFSIEPSEVTGLYMDIFTSRDFDCASGYVWQADLYETDMRRYPTDVEAANETRVFKLRKLMLNFFRAIIEQELNS